jgi:hypothetical protein
MATGVDKGVDMDLCVHGPNHVATVCLLLVYPIQPVSTSVYLGRPRVDPGTPGWRICELPLTLVGL